MRATLTSVIRRAVAGFSSLVYGQSVADEEPNACMNGLRAYALIGSANRLWCLLSVQLAFLVVLSSLLISSTLIFSASHMSTTYQECVREKRGAHPLVHGET